MMMSKAMEKPYVQTEGKAGRARFRLLLSVAILPLLAACNSATTGDGDNSLALHKPESRILGDAFSRNNARDTAQSNLSANAEALPGVIQQAAQQSEGQGNYAEAAAYWSLLHYRDPQNETVAINYAEALRKSDAAEQALAVLKPYSEPETATPAALIAFAKANLQAGKLAAALQSARWAVDADPQHAEAYNVLGITLDAIGKHDEAQAAYQSALATGIPDSHRTLNNLAMSYAQSGELTKAQTNLEQAQKLAADDPTVQANLALISAMAGQQRLQPVLASTLPTRNGDSAATIGPERHPQREWPTSQSLDDPRSFAANAMGSFDRLTLPRVPDHQVKIEEKDGVLRIEVPATVQMNLPRIASELERTVENVTMSGDDNGLVIAFRLRKDVAVAKRVVGERLAVDFLLSPTALLNQAQSAAIKG